MKSLLLDKGGISPFALPLFGRGCAAETTGDSAMQRRGPLPLGAPSPLALRSALSLPLALGADGNFLLPSVVAWPFLGGFMDFHSNIY